jgi:aldehyde dehydrogenase (NAD+)
VFDEREVAVFEGGVDVARALLELPVDHIFFTGSPAVGRVVMAAAARHLATVTLELGGKCPAVVDGTSDLARAAAVIGAAKVNNAGQICLAPDHVWIREDLREEFTGLYLAWIRDNVYSSDGAIDLARMPRMVDRRNFDRVWGYVDDAVARGATALGTGRTDETTLTIEPAVLIDVPLDARVMQDEIFGPVLPVLTYRSLDEVTDHIRDGGKPLAIYAHTSDDALVERLLTTTSSGGMTVNGASTHVRDPRLPFGGVGTSGMGAYHGLHGFRELSHARAVAEHPPA